MSTVMLFRVAIAVELPKLRNPALYAAFESSCESKPLKCLLDLG